MAWGRKVSSLWGKHCFTGCPGARGRAEQREGHYFPSELFPLSCCWCPLHFMKTDTDCKIISSSSNMRIQMSSLVYACWTHGKALMTGALKYLRLASLSHKSSCMKVNLHRNLEFEGDSFNIMKVRLHWFHKQWKIRVKLVKTWDRDVLEGKYLSSLFWALVHYLLCRGLGI